MKNVAPETDARTKALRTGATEYELPHFSSRKQWLARAEELRTHILAVNGLLPMPSPVPLKARIFDTTLHESEGYSVSKVYFQSHPGLLVTGNLFRPFGKKGPFPAVLNPHGHWFGGRLEDSEPCTNLGRGITFARQGYVAFCYSMIGFNDSTQIPHGNNSDQQVLWGFSLLSLQLYNSIRAVDFLQSLPDVDPERIGCTGESGGGTQTFLLTAVDPRIKVSAPVNMISAHMQGGCVCENGPSLRLDTTNPEIAALMAPRPMLMVSATGDWTKNTPRVEYPFIRSIYKLLGAEDRVECVQIEAPHNFNCDSRNAVYKFFGKWLLGKDAPENLEEQPYQLDPPERYLVFSQQERPGFAPEGDRLHKKIIAHRRRQIAALMPKDKASLHHFQAEMGTALNHLLHVQLPSPRQVRAFRDGAPQKREDAKVQSLILTRPTIGDRVPAYLITPTGKQKPDTTVIVSEQGKNLLYGADGNGFHPAVADQVRAGQTILLVCCWGTPGADLPEDCAKRSSQVFFYHTYSLSDHAHRIQDILTALGYLSGKQSIRKINLLGLGSMGPLALLARTQAHFVHDTTVDMNCLRRGRDEDFISHLYIPGIRNIGDIATVTALAGSKRLRLEYQGSL